MVDRTVKFISLWIAGICVIVFLIQSIVPGFTETFYLSSDALSMPWQFVTAIFLHGSLVHLIYNMFALIMFGLMLEGLIGEKKFMYVFLFSGVVANFIAFNFYPSSLGASGAIMGVLGMLAVLRPGMTVWAFNLPMPMFIAAILWAGGSVLGIFGFGDQNTGHIAHLSGIIIGIGYGFYLRFKYDKRKNIIFENKVVIDEDSMRNWEDRNL
jgi:membrane associated rhomboid family serine protease